MPRGIPNKRYTSEFKRKVIEQMWAEHLSYRETARLYEINDHHRIQAWERIYLEEGPGSFEIERRGRSSKGRPQTLDKRVEDDLIAEIQQLRMENDYLKKLNALVQKRVLQEKRPK